MPEPVAEITCREIAELVTGYLEQALPDAQRRRFEEHIGLGPDCDTYSPSVSIVCRVRRGKSFPCGLEVG